MVTVEGSTSGKVIVTVAPDSAMVSAPLSSR